MQNEKNQILRKALGRSWKTGKEILFSCPKCKHHKLKLSINIERDAFKCWICDFSGNNISYLIKSFAPEFYGEWLSVSNSVDIGRYESLFEEEVEVQESVSLPENFKTLTGPKTSIKRRPLSYLYSRGFTDIDIQRWKIGYCDYGKYENRIIVPSFTSSGVLDYFIARTYTQDRYRYKNPKASKDIIFNDLNIEWSDDIIIVEGVFDAMKCENGIPLLGSTLKEGTKLFEKICKFKKVVYLALDIDAKKKELQIAKKLKEYGVDTKIIDISPYSDVGEMTASEFANRKLKADFVSEMDYLRYELNF